MGGNNGCHQRIRGTRVTAAPNHIFAQVRILRKQFFDLRDVLKTPGNNLGDSSAHHGRRPRKINTCRERRRQKRSTCFRKPLAFWFARFVRRIGRFAIDVRTLERIDQRIEHHDAHRHFDFLRSNADSIPRPEGQPLSPLQGWTCVPKGANVLFPLIHDRSLLNKRQSTCRVKSHRVSAFHWRGGPNDVGRGKAAVKHPLTYLDFCLSAFTKVKACSLSDIECWETKQIADPVQHEICGQPSTLEQLLDDTLMTYLVWAYASTAHKRGHEKMAHLARELGKAGDVITSWLLDSGANAWLVPKMVDGKINPLILDLTHHTRKMGTASGSTVATVGVVATPLGLRYAAVVDADVPHLLPLWDLACVSDFIWRKGKLPKVVFQGQHLPIQMSYGCPNMWVKNGVVVHPKMLGEDLVVPKVINSAGKMSPAIWMFTNKIAMAISWVR